MKDTPAQAGLDPALVDEAYPLQKHMGFYLTAWEDGYARFELPMQHFLLNRYGLLHGGIHAMMIDTVIGYAGCWTGDPDNKRFGMTLSLNVNYLGRLQGQTLIAEGWKTGGGRSNWFAEAKITDELGTLAATGTGALRYRKGGTLAT